MKKKTRKKLLLFNSILLLLTIAGIVGLFMFMNDEKSAPNSNGVEVAGNDQNGVTITPPTEATPAPTATPVPTPTPPAYTDAVWIGVGDIMSHTPQLPGAYDKATDSYNFDDVFAPIAHIVAEGDWRMANLETPMAGKEFGYTGYPTFNAPIELAQALWNTGFNTLSTANNHTLDKGVKGAIATLDNVKALGFVTVGSARDME